MTPPRDLADAQNRLNRVHTYADDLRELATISREAGGDYLANVYDNTAAALERIIGGKQ